MEALRLISLISDILLMVIGVYLIATVARVYSLYQILGVSRTVMTPFLLVGALFALLGATELLEVFAIELGPPIHSVIMLLTAILFLYGLRDYHKMLKKTKEKT